MSRVEEKSHTTTQVQWPPSPRSARHFIDNHPLGMNGWSSVLLSRPGIFSFRQTSKQPADCSPSLLKSPLSDCCQCPFIEY